ncbi:MAG: Chorismate mutase [Polaromonas sp.]|nr:Chorismate mutase [Polaromonas sp.]
MKLSQSVAHCHSMADVRRNIDALDARIVALVAERSGYVAQAARIKQDISQVHDQGRIDFIVDRVKAMAAGQGAPQAVLEATYRAMIDAFIEFERGEFKRLRLQPSQEG